MNEIISNTSCVVDFTREILDSVWCSEETDFGGFGKVESRFYLSGGSPGVPGTLDGV